MNEGCNGGWALFHGIFAENANLISEKCAPYQATTAKWSCGDFKHCKPIAKVNKSYYVGGYNFKPTVEMIQKEIMMKGPIVTEFRTNDVF